MCPAFENKTPDDLFDVDDIAALLTDFMDTNGNNDNNHYDTIEDDIEEFIVSAVDTETVVPEPESIQEDVQPDGTVSEKLNIDRHFPIVEKWKEPQDIIIDRKQIESQPKGPLVALNSIIDEKSKKLIQKKIFEKDDIVYNNFIMRLESVDNWKEAKQIIDEELLIRAVQPFSKEALTLGDLVFNRYFPKKK